MKPFLDFDKATKKGLLQVSRESSQTSMPESPVIPVPGTSLIHGSPGTTGGNPVSGKPGFPKPTATPESSGGSGGPIMVRTTTRLKKIDGKVQVQVVKGHRRSHKVGTP